MSDALVSYSSKLINRMFDLLRHRLSPSEAVPYILALLFLEVVSAQELSAAPAGADGEHQSSFGLSLLKRAPNQDMKARLGPGEHEGIGTRLNHKLRQLEEANPTELGGVFRELDFESNRFGSYLESALLLETLVGTAAEAIREAGPDIETVFDTFFSMASSSLVIGLLAPEFNTPPSLCSLVAEIVDVKENETIYDPTCGSGQLLLACATHARNRQTASIVGREINFTAWALAKVNALVHGYSSKMLRHESCLTSGTPDSASRNGFDVIVAHPPWGLHASQLGRVLQESPYGPPPRGNSDYAFLLHMLMSSKKENGRIAAIVSNGSLSRIGAEAEIRRRLCEANLIDTVISLPDKMFQATSATGSILVLRTGRPEGSQVFFIDARPEASISRRGNYFSAESVERLVHTYRSKAESDVSRCVTLDEISANDYSLHVPRYICSDFDSQSLSLEEIAERRKELNDELESLNRQIENEISKFL